ncbi:MAG: hypothetical protein JKY88_09350 [Pseudomonadales bacterium]|nr:hypothetical protein [Pseudomonadales bacterium]
MARMLNINLVILLISSPFFSSSVFGLDVLIGRNLTSLITPLQSSVQTNHSFQIKIASQVRLPNARLVSFGNQSHAQVSFCVKADELAERFNFSVMDAYSDLEKYTVSFFGEIGPRSLVNACLKSDNVQVMVVRDDYEKNHKENGKFSQYVDRYTLLVAPE